MCVRRRCPFLHRTPMIVTVLAGAITWGRMRLRRCRDDPHRVGQGSQADDADRRGAVDGGERQAQPPGDSWKASHSFHDP